MKVLIADDDSLSLRILETMVREWGYETVSCRDGAEAWGAMQSEGSPKLAILDWMIPGMDGFEATASIN